MGTARMESNVMPKLGFFFVQPIDHVLAVWFVLALLRRLRGVRSMSEQPRPIRWRRAKALAARDATRCGRAL